MMNWMQELQRMSVIWFQWQGTLRDENDMEFRCESRWAKATFAFHDAPEPWL